MASFKNLISTTSAQIASGGTITGDLVINGDLQVDGDGSLSFDEIIEGTSVIDVTNTEAFLVRKDSDGGDTLLVDTTNQKIGINKSSPTGTLHISAPSGSAPTMYFEQYTSATDGTLGEISFGNRAVDGQLALISVKNDGANDSAHIAFSTEVASGALAERMRITSTGLVGIGGTPSNPLDVIVDATDGGFNKVINILDADTDTTADTRMALSWQKYSTGTTAVDMGSIAMGASQWSSVAGNRHTYMVFNTVYDGSAGEKMRITDDGKVGIGTDSPHSPLTIETSLDAADDADQDKFALMIRNAADDNNEEIGIGFRISANQAATNAPGGAITFERTTSNSVGSLHFKTAPSSETLPTRMTIDSSGRVGIGTVAPGDYNAVADDLVVYNSGHSGITIASGTSNYGALYFADATSGTGEYAGAVEYNHSSTQMKIWSDGGSGGIVLDTHTKISLSNNDGNTGNTVFGKSAFNANTTDNDYNTVFGELAMGTGTPNSAAYNTAIGYKSLEDITSAHDNTAVGNQSMMSITSGQYNTVVGSSALATATTAGENVCIGYRTMYVAEGGESQNVAIGARAMADVQEGSNNGDADYNIAIGYNALLGGDFDTNDRQLRGNIAIGGNAMIATGANAQTGTIAIGEYALTALTTGDANLAVGYKAGTAITTGGNNTAIGYEALDGIDTATSNTAVGALAMSDAGNAHDKATANVAIGFKSMAGTFTDSDIKYNVAVGTKAMQLGALNGLQHCTVIGNGAGKDLTSGSRSTLVGSLAGENITSGENNICIGASSGATLTTGGDHVLVGKNAGDVIAAGQTGTNGTIAIGTDALGALTTGAGNVGIGYQCLDAITNSANNTALGYQAMTAANHIDAVDNTCIGYKAGDVIQGGGDNTCIGALTDPSAHGGVNQTVIGKGTTGQADNSVTLGNGSVTKVYMSSDGDAEMYANGTINTSDKRLKENINDADLGLSFVNALRPVSYKFIDDKKPEKLKYGIIAQEVQEVLKESGNEDFAGITDKGDYLGADYVQFIAPLIKAVQELSAKVEALEKK